MVLTCGSNDRTSDQNNSMVAPEIRRTKRRISSFVEFPVSRPKIVAEAWKPPACATVSEPVA